MKIIENIKDRRSIRTFLSQPIRQSSQEEINEIISRYEDIKGPLGNSINLWESHLKNEKKIGTYGVIKNPAGYIVGSVDHSDEGLLDFGYLFEKMILELNEIKIGTCWMAGTFKRKGIAATNNQLIPAVTPIGHYDQSRFFEKMMRKVVKADLRKPFETLFFEEDFNTPYKGQNSNLLEAFEAVRLGPSASNKQPWRLLLKNNEIHFYLAEDMKYNSALGFKVQYLDMGIAMYHLEAVLSDNGVEGRWIGEDPKINQPSNYIYIMTYKLA